MLTLTIDAPNNVHPFISLVMLTPNICFGGSWNLFLLAVLFVIFVVVVAGCLWCCPSFVAILATNQQIDQHINEYSMAVCR